MRISIWQYLKTDTLAAMLVGGFAFIPTIAGLLVFAQESETQGVDLRRMLTLSGTVSIFGLLLFLLVAAAHIGAINRAMARGHVDRTSARDVVRDGPLTIIAPDGPGPFDRLPSILIPNANIKQIQVGMSLTFARLGAFRMVFPNRVPLEAFFDSETIRESLDS